MAELAFKLRQSVSRDCAPEIMFQAPRLSLLSYLSWSKSKI